MKCRGPTCGAEITFISKRGGGKHPVNLPAKQLWVEGDDGLCDLRLCYESHYATCPDADAFRPPRDEREGRRRDG
jgi:hypothetical protein